MNDKMDTQEARKIIRHYQILALSVIATLATGTVFYHIVEKWNWVDSLYFSVISLTTVGYGDFTPKTTLGKLFTILFLFIGIGLMAGLINNLVRSRVAKQKIRQEHK